ncbi:MAG TPA: carbohydrate ABC transporter permease [Anaerolineales bacterium]|nr:carbohydrate ABC transporter permease [Anaerolineales bacterium]
MSVNTSLQQKSVKKMDISLSWKKFVKRGNPLFITVVTTAILALFLMPFLYMVFTSLKNQTQVATTGAPIWPAKYPTYIYSGENTKTYTLKVNKSGFPVDQTINMSDYSGKELEVYKVPQPDGTTKEMALIKGYQKSSIFIDPAKPANDPIVWTGYYLSLSRSWVFAPQWSNYVEMWNDVNYPRVLWNTFFYAFMTTIGVLVSCIPVAYGFSRFRFPGRDILFVVLLAVIFLPTTVTIIPTFTFFSKIGWVGTWLPLIVPSFFANAYDTFLLRQFFMTLPRELDEAAMIDGASPFRVLWSVIIPQSYPVIVAVTVFHLVWAWNDYFGPLVYLSSRMDLQPISVALQRFNTLFGSRPELIQAGSLLTLLFPLLLFFIAQRFFVQGIVITGVEK